MERRVVSNDVFIPEIIRLVNEGSDVVFTPKGSSMLPFIRGGQDSVLLRSVSCLDVGDIVLARYAGKYVLHRVIELDEDRVLLMGDGNLSGTELCMREDILAVAIQIIKGNKVIDCRSSSHRRRSEVWKRLIPVRRWLLAIYRRLIFRII